MCGSGGGSRARVGKRAHTGRQDGGSRAGIAAPASSRETRCAHKEDSQGCTTPPVARPRSAPPSARLAPPLPSLSSIDAEGGARLGPLAANALRHAHGQESFSDEGDT
jgi:hypothetical protein